MNDYGRLRANWMGSIPDQQKTLFQLTIPGTHDTCTAGLDRPSVSRCQELDLGSQLAQGIRFIDIRLVPEINDAGESDLRVYHSSDPTNVWFTRDVFQVCKDFLHDHPSETIIMSIKNEQDVPETEFVDALAPFLLDTVFYREIIAATGQTTLSNLSVPTLEQCKNHIVLFRRYSGSDDGIDAVTDWPADEQTTQVTSGNVPMMIEDTFGFMSGQGDVKWGKVKLFLERAVQDVSTTWWITFSSASGGQPPRWFADRVNPQLQDWLRLSVANGGGLQVRLGLVIMDFPTHAMIDSLIARNHLNVPGKLQENTAYRIQTACLVRGDAAVYLGDPHLAANRWNYVQAYAGTTTHALHSLHKVDGNTETSIHEGDVVTLLCTAFTNDDYCYVAANNDGINCCYDRLDGPKYGAVDLQWVIERSPGSTSPSTEIQEGDPIRLRSRHTDFEGYLLPGINGYVCAQSLSTYPQNEYYSGGFDWVFTRPPAPATH